MSATEAENECQYCRKIFSQKYNLIKHQKTAKYCLSIQGKREEIEFMCSGCKYHFSQKHRLTKHEERCPPKLRQLWEDELGIIEEKHQRLLQEKDEIITKKTGKNKQLQLQLQKLRDEIVKLREQLSEAKGKFAGYDKAAAKYKRNKTVNNYISPKLLTISVDNIRPFTPLTIQQDLEDGRFTKCMFERGPRGIIEFVSAIIQMENENGEIERSYACTDSSRYKFHRLVESKEWKTDNGAHFLNEVLDQLDPLVKGYYTGLLDERKAIRSTDEEEDDFSTFKADFLSKKILLLSPVYKGVVSEKGPDREKLFNELRTKISSIASV